MKFMPLSISDLIRISGILSKLQSAMTYKQYLCLKNKLKSNCWHTPTIEEKAKIILMLKQSNDVKAIKLLQFVLKDENVFIIKMANNILKHKS